MGERRVIGISHILCFMRIKKKCPVNDTSPTGRQSRTAVWLYTSVDRLRLLAQCSSFESMVSIKTSVVWTFCSELCEPLKRWNISEIGAFLLFPFSLLFRGEFTCTAGACSSETCLKQDLCCPRHASLKGFVGQSLEGRSQFCGLKGVLHLSGLFQNPLRI